MVINNYIILCPQMLQTHLLQKVGYTYSRSQNLSRSEIWVLSAWLPDSNHCQIIVSQLVLHSTLTHFFLCTRTKVLGSATVTISAQVLLLRL